MQERNGGGGGGGRSTIESSVHTQSRTMRLGSERAASNSLFLDLEEKRLLVTRRDAVEGREEGENKCGGNQRVEIMNSFLSAGGHVRCSRVEEIDVVLLLVVVGIVQGQGCNKAPWCGWCFGGEEEFGGGSNKGCQNVQSFIGKRMNR